MTAASWSRRLVQSRAGGGFDTSEIEGLPEPVRRYFATTVRPGTPLARSARLTMRGSIKVGRRWLPFRARQIESPHRGLVWSARAGGVIVGSDRYVDGAGEMDWRVLGLARVAHADGPDVSRSTAGRAGAEGVWVPTALLPRFGVAWTATDDRVLTAGWRLDDTDIDLRCRVDANGHLVSVSLDRWGDPDGTGAWGYHPFGFEVTERATFGGLILPAAGRAGWFFGTERWPEGEFFRVRLLDHRPLG